MTTMEQISEVNRYMQIPFACPSEIRAKIATLRIPADEGSHGRIMTNWRAGPGPRPAGPRPVQGPGPLKRTVHGPAPRYGNKGKADVTVEERMMDRIRDKMNKFSIATYDPTKAWLSQLLDSGETDFLTDFITLVFEKAATEKMFCPIYARLITELRAEFPHLDSETKRIFSEFMNIFVEANEEEGAGYQGFLAFRERRKFRRGYSTFVAEIAKNKVITTEDVLRTCTIILDGLVLAKGQEDQQLLCEEYADCLTVLMKGIDAGPIISKVKLAMDRVGSPSLSNKARFALMDILGM